jgi:hypothetical protein
MVNDLVTRFIALGLLWLRHRSGRLRLKCLNFGTLQQNLSGDCQGLKSLLFYEVCYGLPGDAAHLGCFYLRSLRTIRPLLGQNVVMKA